MSDPIQYPVDWIGGIQRRADPSDKPPFLPNDLRNMRMTKDGFWEIRPGVEKEYPDRGQHYEWTTQLSNRGIANCRSDNWPTADTQLYYLSHKRKVWAFGENGGIRYAFLGVAYSETTTGTDGMMERDEVAEFQKFCLFRGVIDDDTGNVNWHGLSSNATCARLAHKYDQDSCFIEYSMVMNDAKNALFIAIVLRDSLAATHSILRVIKVSDLYNANWGTGPAGDLDDDIPTWEIYKAVESLSLTETLTHDVDIAYIAYEPTSATESFALIYGMFNASEYTGYSLMVRRILVGILSSRKIIEDALLNRYGAVIQRKSVGATQVIQSVCSIAYLQLQSNFAQLKYCEYTLNQTFANYTLVQANLFAFVGYSPAFSAVVGPILAMTNDAIPVPVFCYRVTSLNNLFVKIGLTGTPVQVTSGLAGSGEYPTPFFIWQKTGFDMTLRDGFLVVYYSTYNQGITEGTYQIWRKTLVFDKSDEDYRDGTFFDGELVEDFRESPGTVGYERHSFICAAQGGYPGDPEKWIAFVRFNSWTAGTPARTMNSSTVNAIRQDRGLVSGSVDIRPVSLIRYRMQGANGIEVITVVQCDDNRFYYRRSYDWEWKLLRGQMSAGNEQFVQETVVDGRAFFWMLGDVLRAGVGNGEDNVPVVYQHIKRQIYRNEQSGSVPAISATAVFNSSQRPREVNPETFILRAINAGETGNLIQYELTQSVDLISGNRLYSLRTWNPDTDFGGVITNYVGLSALLIGINATSATLGVTAEWLRSDWNEATMWIGNQTGYLSGGRDSMDLYQPFYLNDRMFHRAKCENPFIADLHLNGSIAEINTVWQTDARRAYGTLKDVAVDDCILIKSRLAGSTFNTIRVETMIVDGGIVVRITDNHGVKDSTIGSTILTPPLLANAISSLFDGRLVIATVIKNAFPTAGQDFRLDGGADAPASNASSFYALEDDPLNTRYGKIYPSDDKEQIKLGIGTLVPIPLVTHPFLKRTESYSIDGTSYLATYDQPYIDVYLGFAYRYDNSQISQIACQSWPATFKIGAMLNGLVTPGDLTSYFLLSYWSMLEISLKLRRWTAKNDPGDPRITSVLIFMAVQETEDETKYDALTKHGHLIKEVKVAKDNEPFKDDPANGDSQWTVVDDDYVQLTTYVDYQNYVQTWLQTETAIDYIGHANPVYRSDTDTPNLQAYKYAAVIAGRPFYLNLRINGQLHEDFLMWAGDAVNGGRAFVTPDITGLDYLRRFPFKGMGLFAHAQDNLVVFGESDIEWGKVDTDTLSWRFIETLRDIGAIAPRSISKIAEAVESGQLGGVFFLNKETGGHLFNLYEARPMTDDVLQDYIGGSNPTGSARVETTHLGVRSMTNDQAMAIHLQGERLFLLHFPNDGITLLRDFVAESNARALGRSSGMIWMEWAFTPNPKAWCLAPEQYLLYTDDSQIYRWPRASASILDNLTTIAIGGRIGDMRVPPDGFVLPVRMFAEFKLVKGAGVSLPTLVLTLHKDDGDRTDTVFSFPYSDTRIRRSQGVPLGRGRANRSVGVSWSLTNADNVTDFELHSIVLEMDKEKRWS